MSYIKALGAALFFLQLLSGCAQRLYFRSDIFDRYHIVPYEVSYCTAVMSGERLDYLLCESDRTTDFKIKIIPKDSEQALMTIVFDRLKGAGSLNDVMEREIEQVNILVNYILDPPLKKTPKKDEVHRLYVRSLNGENYFVEGLLLINKYVEDRTPERNRLR